MKYTAALHRCVVRANVPAALLMALLQRTPLLRMAGIAEETVIASPVGNVLRSAVAAAASLGVMHTLVGASGTIEANPDAVLSATAGKVSTGAAFDVPDTENPVSSWVVLAGSTIPPGMIFSGGTGSAVLTGPGTINVDFGVGELTGTPTVAGIYTLLLEASDGPNGTGDITPEYVYEIDVAAAQGPPPMAPTFTLNASPSTVTVASGRSVVFNAIATGTPAPTYQWTLNGSATIHGAAVTTDKILWVTGATSSSAGTYTCTATNSSGSVSTSATLAVTTTSNPGYLTNLSGRGVVGSGLANGLFGGFGIAGTGSKQLLIRGIGPGLNTFFGLAGYLTDPLLTLFNSVPAQIAQNDNWGGTATLINAEATLGAFTVPANSLDAMLYLPEPVASYSAEVSGVGTATGVALVELYDADPSPPAARFVNLSVRAPVGAGANILVGGFVIGGTTAETLLVRAVGPGLASFFGLTGTLAQPVLTLYTSTPAVIYSNTVWGGDPVLVSASNAVGAYTLPTASQDSLLLVTLPPGGYSAQIAGVANTTGIATVEIYEVP
jgi:hypothetical protein